MDERLAKVLRPVRTGIQMALDPLDQAHRSFTGRKDYPPLWIRQKVGNVFDFETSGAEYASYLKLLCGLKAGDNLLDIGCGCGLMALKHNENPSIPQYIFPGNYCGVDSDKQLIDWCTKYLTKPGIKFHWLPHGSPQDMIFGPGQFNVILCKSLFTHLYPSEMMDYLVDMEDLLAPGGSILLTLFIIDKRELMGRYTFKTDYGIFAVERKSRHRLAMGYKEDWLLNFLEKSGYPYDIYYGSWRGDKKGLSFQDIVIIRKVK